MGDTESDSLIGKSGYRKQTIVLQVEILCILKDFELVEIKLYGSEELLVLALENPQNTYFLQESLNKSSLYRIP